MENIDKRALLQKAQTFYQQGRLDLAINEFLKITQIDPYNIVALNTIGDIYYRQGNSKQAFNTYQRVAKIYIEQGEYPKAIGVYKKIVHVDPNNPHALYELGKLYENEGLIDDALEHYLNTIKYMPASEDKILEDIYSRLSEMDPENIELHLSLAENFLKIGKNNEAKEEYLTAIKGYVLRGDMASAENILSQMSSFASEEDLLFAKGIIAQKKEDYVTAETIFKQVISKNQYSVDAYYQLGLTRILSGREQQALIPFQQCLKFKPDFIPVLEFLGDNYQKQNKKEMAVERYEKAVKSALDKLLFNEAKRILKKIVEIDPNNIPAIERLKSLGEIPDEGTEAIKHPANSREIEEVVKEAAKIGSSEKIDVINIDIPSVAIDFQTKRKITDLIDEANKFAAGGLDEKAEENYKQVLEFDPNNENALNALSENAMMMGDNDNALIYLKHLIKVFVSRADFDKALSVFERGIKLSPNNTELKAFKEEILKRKALFEQMANTEIEDIPEERPEIMTEETPVEMLSPEPEQVKAKPAFSKQEEQDMVSGGEENYVDSFAEKVEEIIGDDLQAHYDMGNAYYSMMLFSKAIYEFQLAAKNDSLFIPSCEQISQCFLDQGLPEAAIKWLNKPLQDRKELLDTNSILSLKFKLAQSFEMLGDKNTAFKLYLEIYGENARFQGVNKIISKMKQELNVSKKDTVAEEILRTENLLDSIGDNKEKGDTQKKPPPGDNKNDPPKQNPKISFL